VVTGRTVRAGELHATYTHPPSARGNGKLPPFGGNAQLGCGLVVRRIKGHRYLYFWEYKERSWGSRRAWSYVGRVGKDPTRTRANELLLDYHRRVRKELERRMTALEAAAAVR
jgi:hypothetical protein